MAGTRKRHRDSIPGGSVAKKTRTESDVEHFDLSSGDNGDITGDSLYQIIDFQSVLSTNYTYSIGQAYNEVDHFSTRCGEINKNSDSRLINT